MQLPRTAARTGARIFHAAVLLLLIDGAVYSARAGTFVVTSLADSGDGRCTAADIGDGCTLREAINAANASGGADTVDATGLTGTVTLTTALPDLSSDINIVGPGANLLKVSRGEMAPRFGVFTISPNVTASISGVTMTGGWTADGGNGTSSGGTAESGGGIHNKGNLTITRCTVTGNQTGNGGSGGLGYGGSGGGIMNLGTLTLIDSTVSDNRTGDGGSGRPGGGGGVPGGSGGHGGGIDNGGTATVINTTISGNRTGNGATGGPSNTIPGLGAGIYNAGEMTISNTTISGNETGTMFVDGPNSSITGGGGIYQATGQTTINNSTITANKAAIYGGGIHRSAVPGASGTVTLRSTIVAGNSGEGPDIYGTVQSDGYNLIGDQRKADISPNPGAGPNFFGAPELDPLAENGGPTRTHLPRANSPAIDKGRNFSGRNTDQRGLSRTVNVTDARYPSAGDGTDIGAVELAPVLARNLSTRAKVEAADNVLIAGFIITGTVPKKLVIRALGPSLSDANVRGVLEDPELELRTADGSLLRANDNWQDDAAQAGELQAAGLAPARTQESAILLTLPPSAYTAIVRGKNKTGVALVEVYDIGNPNSELANVSARSVVQSGDNVMIGGFTLGPGDGHTNLIVRALGPSLPGLGINNSLTDPTLDLRDTNGNQIGFNDNWRDDALKAAEISAKGLAPPNPNESALSLTLAPGQYTAIVRGQNEGTGIGLIEIYNTH
jgi:CSLREA domain-containing protein